jgi:PAS domain S-box-containing protein
MGTADIAADMGTSEIVDVMGPRPAPDEQHRLIEELKSAVQRYELALRRSSATVFTQDLDLRYTAISNSLVGHEANEFIGRTDEDLLAGGRDGGAIALKRESLASGTPQDGEVHLRLDGGDPQWFDLHIEPLRDSAGAVVGLVGTAFDITTRKEGEEHLRLLMRELTHRSKNLLAVIQAMARQTARHSTSIEGFMAQFDARLQALATSHDALIDKGWHGAALFELAQMQVKPFAEGFEDQVSIQGPTVLLKPEAAQALGLALHELAHNAKRFGALSVPDGHVSMTWLRLPHPDGEAVEFKWIESGGPAVAMPLARRFGSMAIERNLERAANGKVKLAFLPAGVQCEILIPPQHLVGSVDRGSR